MWSANIWRGIKHAPGTAATGMGFDRYNWRHGYLKLLNLISSAGWAVHNQCESQQQHPRWWSVVVVAAGYIKASAKEFSVEYSLKNARDLRVENSYFRPILNNNNHFLARAALTHPPISCHQWWICWSYWQSSTSARSSWRVSTMCASIGRIRSEISRKLVWASASWRSTVSCTWAFSTLTLMWILCVDSTSGRWRRRPMHRILDWSQWTFVDEERTGKLIILV